METTAACSGATCGTAIASWQARADRRIALVLLTADPNPNPDDPAYQAAANEIIRGVRLVSQLEARSAEAGWIAIQTNSAAHAHWLAEQIVMENVEARADGDQLLVPVAAWFTVKGEIKNVVTAVAKTTHYWIEHLPPDVKRTLALQTGISSMLRRVGGWFGRE